MNASPVWQWSAAETAQRIRAREIGATEVVTAHLDRMRAANPAVNAVVVDLGEQALRAAKAADQAPAAGALHGVPVTVKINIDLEGQANSNGVPAFANNIAPGDSPVVANLKKAGAIIIGMTNTPEFSMRGFTENPLHGRTLNPWDAAVTCGGSSGGAGASVALGIGAIAHGNDIGGSLRWPAHCNGVATIKPTQGRIPAFNPSATVERALMAQFMSSQGPLARSVADVRLGLAAMSMRDPRDPWWVPAPLTGDPVPPPIRVAMAKLPDDITADDDVVALYRCAAEHLADAGYAVREVALPDLDATWTMWRDIIATELAVLQGEQMRALGSPDFIRSMDGLLAAATVLDREGYMKTIAHRSRILRNWLLFLEEYPVILAPVTPRRTPAVNADLAGDGFRAVMMNDLRFVSAINVTGLPAAVVPVGLSAAGTPVGVQLIASRYREDLCLDAAAAIEARAGRLVEQLWARG